jgi:WD40 repeat protein
LVTVAQRNDFEARIWRIKDNKIIPVDSFSGHEDIVRSLDWRISSHDASFDHPEHQYQLISLSRDQTIRLWHIDSLLQEDCGSSHSANEETRRFEQSDSKEATFGSPGLLAPTSLFETDKSDLKLELERLSESLGNTIKIIKFDELERTFSCEVICGLRIIDITFFASLERHFSVSESSFVSNTEATYLQHVGIRSISFV